jgi:ABC-type Mn2+/Zn2+ transport system ATPase subunit
MGFGVSMRIKQVSVKGLFGIFDHVIPLNLDERITIIHAPNGYGKTVILKMLYGLFNAQYFELQTIPYKCFRVDFVDGGYIEVNRDSTQIRQSHLHLVFCDNQGRITKKQLPIPQSFIDQLAFPNGMQANSKRSDAEKLADEECLKQIREQAHISLIQSDRLQYFASEGDQAGQLILLPLSMVTKCSEDLARHLQERLTEYAILSQSLDRSFPSRVLQQQHMEQSDQADLQNRLDQLEKHRARLIASGLLKASGEQESPIQTQDVRQEMQSLLAIYVEDGERKLAVFEEDRFAAKVELFQRIINTKFSYKKIMINHDEGFVLTSTYSNGNGQSATKLSLGSLSSGEQHELILLYELLFQVAENSLVLIDEPELSLHVGWQVNFLRDLQEITQLAKIDVLIATHSPSLINDRWDLTVELKGVSQ